MCIEVRPPKYKRAVKIVPGDQSTLHSNSYGGPETRDPETLTRFQVFGARGQKDSRDSEISAPPQQIPSNLSAKLSSRCHLSEVPLWGLRAMTQAKWSAKSGCSVTIPFIPLSRYVASSLTSLSHPYVFVQVPLNVVLRGTDRVQIPVLPIPTVCADFLSFCFLMYVESREIVAFLRSCPCEGEVGQPT